jgi:succinyl-CoA synthetase beta subunit
MGKYGVNLPKGVAVSSLDEVKKAIQDVFPGESEVITISIAPNICK